MKKTGLGKDPLSWITPTIPENNIKKPLDRKVKRQTTEKSTDNKQIPKFQTFDVRLTSLLREDQLDFLDRLIRDIQKNRSKEYRKERITKNTLIRVFIDAFMDATIDTANIPDEEELLKRARQKIRY